MRKASSSEGAYFCALRFNRDDGLPRRAHPLGQARLGQLCAGQADTLDVICDAGFFTAHS